MLCSTVPLVGLVTTRLPSTYSDTNLESKGGIKEAPHVLVRPYVVLRDVNSKAQRACKVCFVHG